MSGRRSSSGRLRSLSSSQLQRDAGDVDSENRTGRGNTDDAREEDKKVDAAQSEKIKSMRDRINKKDRRVAEIEPELHVIGEIEGGSDFGNGACCRWQFDFGQTWVHLGGQISGQTQVDYPRENESAVWAHPLDVHFLCKGVQGWPRILLQVWNMDEHGMLHLAGYGFTHVPNTPGSYELDVATWRPVGTLKEEISALFLGTTPQLRDIDLLFRKAWSDRSRISTQSAGTVRINVDVVQRNFRQLNVDV